MSKNRTSEEHKFELDQITGSISRQIDEIVSDLNFCKERINLGRSPEGSIPKNSMMDLMIRFGQLCEMQRMSSAFQREE